jgi:hypothetical protein
VDQRRVQQGTEVRFFFFFFFLLKDFIFVTLYHSACYIINTPLYGFKKVASEKIPSELSAWN